jgi:hypothetical protein
VAFQNVSGRTYGTFVDNSSSGFGIQQQSKHRDHTYAAEREQGMGKSEKHIFFNILFDMKMIKKICLSFFPIKGQTGESLFDDLGTVQQKGTGNLWEDSREMICSWYNYLKQFVDMSLPFFSCSDQNIKPVMHRVSATEGGATAGGQKGAGKFGNVSLKFH